ADRLCKCADIWIWHKSHCST
ncbi:mCG146522, partial [Mus musculus]